MDILNLSPVLVAPIFFIYNDWKIFVSYFINFLVINPVLKYYIFKPIIGKLGNRPIGDVCLSGYGMPSGHSQALAFFAAYIFYNKNITDYRVKFAAIMFMFAVMYSRVNIRCHTVPQVIVGAFIGWMIFFLILRDK